MLGPVVLVYKYIQQDSHSVCLGGSDKIIVH